jgi:hypothetical protein
MHEQIIHELSSLAGPTGPAPSEDTITADLARGRHAAKRRRLTIAAATGVTAIAAGITAITGVTALTPAPHTTAQTDTNTVPDGTAGSGTATVQLVSYTGAQPDGYTLGKIPDGFTIETSDQHNLILAPTNIDQTATFDDGMVDLRGKIWISMQGSFTYDIDQRKVMINGHPALIALSAGEAPATEVQFQTGTHTVNIQIGNGITLTDQQITEFAESITVTGNPSTFNG